MADTLIEQNTTGLEEVLAMVNDLPDSTPSTLGNVATYHFAEAFRVAEKISEFKTKHPNNLIFGAVSDIHVSNSENTKTSIRHASFALETVGAMSGCDFIVNLGDNGDETHIDPNNTRYPCGLENAKYSINALTSAFNRLLSFNLVGNHDKTDNTQEQYDLIGVHNEFDVCSSTRIRGFGYKDFTDKKVRVIFLNTCDYLNLSGGCALSYEQKDFLMRALDLHGEIDYSEWQILLLSHIPLDWNDGDYNYYADLQTILNAYEDGTKAEITVNPSFAKNETPSEYATYSNSKLVYNYSGKNGAKIIANIHGHLHNNNVGKIVGTNIARVTTVNANPNGNSADKYVSHGDYGVSSTIAKETGTAKDTAATFYCIDLDKQVIYAFGYGADVDRTIIYMDAKTYTVTFNLSNVTASNNATVVLATDAYNNTLTADSGYTLDTVTVTMGGVDITSSVYQNGTIKIADMSADGNTITGDIVITATAKDNYVPVWDIADRTQVSISAGATAVKSFSRKNYYVGAASTGALHGSGYVTGLSVNGNDVTFTSSSKAVGIGLPYHLEAGASYTFSCKASSSARLRVYQYNSDGTFVSGSETYSSSGTTLSHTFTAPDDVTKWVMLLLDTNTVNTSITYTNITLKKN